MNAETSVHSSDDPEYLHHLLYIAWGVIANAGGWPGQNGPSLGWLEAAERWRDEWLVALHDYCAAKESE